MQSAKHIFGSLAIILAAFFISLLNANGTSPGIFSGEIAYTGQLNAFSTGEMAYKGQPSAIPTGEIPNIALFNNPIPKSDSSKSMIGINLAKPQNAAIPLNMTNQSTNVTLPQNMTNSTTMA
ncbi:Uncharacterised protein [uncultured archaeon]|nr:Uncharacterised protein [uncultured archaeon]